MHTALPADGHVHSQFSWDAPLGSMERTCARAVEIGLPAIAFTEHLDHTVWRIDPAALSKSSRIASLAAPDGLVTPPAFDAAGYLAAIDDCRDRFPQLRILSGVEIGEPHRHAAAVDAILATGRFDRVLGSLHCVPDGDGFAEPFSIFEYRDAASVVHDYLAELPRLIAGSDAFAVLTHIDYPIRYWPAGAGPFDPCKFEDEFRHALRALADTGRALEVNTRLPLDPLILGWWHEEGGTAVTFGSDAHLPDALARGFGEAAAMVAAHGFRPGRHPYDVWIRER